MDPNFELTREELQQHVLSLMGSLPKSWVLFSHGTIVVVHEDAQHEQIATKLLAEYGPVHPGSPAGDFNVIRSAEPGWLVFSHHEDIVTFVHDREVGGPEATDIAVGIFGRGKRGQDAEELTAIFTQQHT